MGEDWRPGDLALCVATDHLEITRSGSLYVVEETFIHPRQGLGLYLHATPRRGKGGEFWGHDPRRFRKIRPHTPDAEDAETIRLLTGKPATVIA